MDRGTMSIFVLVAMTSKINNLAKCGMVTTTLLNTHLDNI